MGGDGGREGWRGGGQKRKHWGDQTGGHRHAFKVLCPEPLITSIMGPRGTTKDQIQEETGCRLLFSNRDECYPGTRYRALCIYGDEPGAITSVLERVVDRIVECGEHEQRSPQRGEGDFTGRAGGEYVLRALITGRMSGAVIGPRGSHIQSVRDDCSARVFIEKANFNGHLMMRVIAAVDGLRSALARINECVQKETDGDDFQEWAAIRAFADDGGSPGKAKGARKGGGKGGWRGGKSGSDGGGEPDSGSRARRGLRDSSGEAPNGDVDADLPGVDLGTLEALSATALEFPSGTLEMEYSLACEMPSQKVPLLIGEDGEHIDGVREATGACVRFEDIHGPEDGQQRLLIQGPLLRVYWAHALMMKRYHDLDAEAAREAEEPTVKQLQEQVADLQKQLAQVQSQVAVTTASGGGRGGKGKGRRG